MECFIASFYRPNKSAREGVSENVRSMSCCEQEKKKEIRSFSFCQKLHLNNVSLTYCIKHYNNSFQKNMELFFINPPSSLSFYHFLCTPCFFLYTLVSHRLLPSPSSHPFFPLVVAPTCPPSSSHCSRHLF